MGLFAVVTFLPLLAAAQVADSPEISRLLREAKSHAALAEDDAITLESYTNSTMSWKSHATRLTEIKHHANDLMADFNKLSSLRIEASPWQMEAIDHINPLLHDISDHLAETMNYLDGNSNKIRTQSFRDYVHVNRELISNGYRIISDLVDYGEAKSKAGDLEKTIRSAAGHTPNN
jgi:hypothetical protein